MRQCPCKRVKCVRHGDCKACRAHHTEEKRGRPTACERLVKKAERKSKSGR